MKKDNIFAIVLCIFVLSVCFKMFLDSDDFQLICTISSRDGNKYCVREREKIASVVDLFAKTAANMEKLIIYLKQKYPDRENVKRLVKRCNPKKIKEILPTSKYTAYSENKGEKLAFCVTTEKNNNELIDENTLMFVALHEMSHIATISVGHTKEFWNNFRFLIQIAKQINVYNPVNYKKNPVSYCGMKITDNPYYDL